MESFYILFLDIDGVLHRPWDLPETTSLDEHVNKFSQQAVNNLNTIIETIRSRTGKPVYVILSSSWRRYGDLPRLREIFKQWPFAGLIIDKTPMFTIPNRPIEIMERLNVWKNTHNVLGYVVLDDYPEGMGVFGDKFVKVSERNLLTEEDARRAVAALLS